VVGAACASPDEFELDRMAEGSLDKHEFHKLLRQQAQKASPAWALNRYYLSEAVPRKDAALMSRCHDRQLRRDWIHRIMDHDGYGEEQGGIERWLVLTDGLGLDRDRDLRRCPPATKFAVEAYVRFVVEQPLVVAVASSLTELFAPSIHRERIVGMLENYDFVDDQVMAYFNAG
jgi:pyrroloquinoline-quinone synthase